MKKNRILSVIRFNNAIELFSGCIVFMLIACILLFLQVSNIAFIISAAFLFMTHLIKNMLKCWNYDRYKSITMPTEEEIQSEKDFINKLMKSYIYQGAKDENQLIKDMFDGNNTKVMFRNECAVLALAIILIVTQIFFSFIGPFVFALTCLVVLLDSFNTRE